MRHTVRFLLLSLALAAVPWLGARADTYKVCNQSAERALVSIVYSVNDARQYISNGWWSLGPNGGCATVLSGAIPIRGVFVRGEAPNNTWDGETLFCVLPRGELANAQGFNRERCAQRGGSWKTYRMHEVRGANFTTNLRPGKSEPVGFGNDSIGCAVDAPCFTAAYQTGDQIIFRFDGTKDFDFYNVRMANGRQVENRSGHFTLNDVLAGHTYGISVQGCHSRVLASSRCSDWVENRLTAK